VVLPARWQNREISENDYDLLMRLARKPSIKVLEAHQLPHVTTTFRADAEWAAANKDANCAICLCAMSSGARGHRPPSRAPRRISRGRGRNMSPDVQKAALLHAPPC
jgi:hypothetical protein